MDSLIIESTEYSPEINFNPSNYTFHVSGESRPENCGKFFNPIITWLTEYEKELSSKQTTGLTLSFIFRFDYFNSTSAKFIMNLFEILKRIENSGKNKLNIEWHYDEMDEDMLDAGKEFSDAVELKFNFISY